MTYRVIWSESAEQQLADIWVNASDQAAVTRASARIDQLLGFDPLHLGESRPKGRRIVIELPLIVTYEVIEDDKRVNVLRVRATRA